MSKIFLKRFRLPLLILVMFFSFGAWATFDTEGFVSREKAVLNRYSFYISLSLALLSGFIFDGVRKKRRIVKKAQVGVIFFILFLLMLALGAALYLMELRWKFDVSFPGLLRVIELSWKDLLIVCGAYILAHVPLGFWFHKCLGPKAENIEEKYTKV